MTNEQKAYPSDVTDEEWSFCVPYLTLMKADAPQREHPLRELCNGLRWLAHGQSVAADAARSAAVARRVSTNPPLGARRLF